MTSPSDLTRLLDNHLKDLHWDLSRRHAELPEDDPEHRILGDYLNSVRQELVIRLRQRRDDPGPDPPPDGVSAPSPRRPDPPTGGAFADE